MNKLFYININQIRDDRAFEAVCSHLSESRMEKINRYQRYNDKLRSAAAGLLIDRGLEFYHLREKSATYTYSEHGKPHVDGHPEIHFSVSHSGDFVVCAFSDEPVGVDIERIKNIKPSLIKYTCDEAESALIDSFEHSDPLHDATFFNIWTKKESFLKFLGIGLTVRPAEVSEKFEKELSCVNFYPYDIAPGYICTLCTAGEKMDCICINVTIHS